MPSTVIAPSTSGPPHPMGLLPSASLGRLRRFTREEYHKLGEYGIVGPDERVELLDGFVVEKPVKNLPHTGVTRRLLSRFPRLLPPGWCLQMQDPLGLSDSEPEPDAAVLRGDETNYDKQQPEPADIGLVIEVADSSLRSDRREKGGLYAESGIPVYWIINLQDGQVEVYTDPDPTADPPAYRTRADYPIGQDVPLVLDGVTAAVLPVADLFPS